MLAFCLNAASSFCSSPWVRLRFRITKICSWVSLLLKSSRLFFLMLCQKEENLFEALLNHFCCYMCFPILICLCSGFFFFLPRLWDIWGCFFFVFSTLFLISVLTDDEIPAGICFLFCCLVGVFFENLLRLFNIHFLLLCLIPLLTVMPVANYTPPLLSWCLYPSCTCRWLSNPHLA